MTQPSMIFDVVERGLAELVSLFRDSSRLRSLVQIALEEVQELEQVSHATVVERMLDTAAGVQLDQYGLVIGEPRYGVSDGIYRRFLQARILSNLSNGQPDVMSRILRLVAWADPVRYIPVYPAGMIFSYVRPYGFSPSLLRARIRSQMVEVAPAGVGVYHIHESLPDGFGFLDDPEAEGFGVGPWAETY